ncbi:VOC family protein [Actinophytocola sp.]|jgi:predicted enzyme related to lactoylglutathione lyase|uniref:VOC family protein n=1 Tax=Actinophytocola sp. TaxID=1872138 RepID=UPI002ED8A1A9
MLRGFATISLFADDVEAAGAWYAELLGIEPYFARPEAGPPMYLEFRVGDHEHELGIIDRRFAPHKNLEPSGAVTYWHVDDLTATLATLESMGATIHEPRTPRGDTGFVTASVVDPFGNILGVMYNPHYVSMLEGKGPNV